jgi:hypothetical protein
MKKTILKLLNIAALLAFGAWFLWPDFSTWNFEWEPLIGIIICLTSYLTLELKDQDANNSEVNNVTKPDVELFTQFSELFSSEVIAFYRDQDFHNSFNRKALEPLFHYVDAWTTAAYEFINQDIQNSHQEFRDIAIRFADKLAEYTISEGSVTATVRPAHSHSGEFPAWARQQAEELNSLSRDFIEKHQTFYKLARKHIHSI